MKGCPSFDPMHSALPKHGAQQINGASKYGDTTNPKHWIAGAIKHPGALHRELGVPQGQKIPAGKLASAAAKGGTLGRRARLAQTLGKMHK